MNKLKSTKEPLQEYLAQETAGFQPIPPVIKWAGGKSRLLSQMETYFPSSFSQYHEPFFGSGSVFFHLALEKGKASWLSDLSKELIIFYQVLKNNTDKLIEEIYLFHEEYKFADDEGKKTLFYDMRVLDRVSGFQETSHLKRALRFYILNKTAYNGLYRVNSKGQFNVPWGKYKKPSLFIPERLRNAAIALKNLSIWLDKASFEVVLQNTKSNDFVYLDPPYAPLSKTSSFTSYTANGFKEKEQMKLASICHELDRNGILFMQSNSNAPLISKLYKKFHIVELKARRSINSKADKRGTITELLIMNY